MKFNNIKITVLLFISSLLAAQQQSINLEEAFRIAIKNNAKLRTENQWVEYQRALINTSKIIAPTNFTAELGQFNSAFFDTGLGISQSFHLPSVYKKRATTYQQQLKAAEVMVKMTEADVRKQLDELYAEYSYLSAKESLLMMQDSLYDSFVQKAIIRWQKGEANILEKTTAEQQKININQQLQMVSKMKAYISESLNWLINDGQKYLPAVETFTTLEYQIRMNISNLNMHPALIVSEQEINVAKAMTETEKTSLLPEITTGYRNVSIRGTGADNVVYGAGNRFSSFQVGIGLPIFRKGIKANIQAAQVMEQVKQSEYELKKAELMTQFNQQRLLYDETLNQLKQFEEKAIPNAKTIRDLSEKQFTNGEINYLEFVQLTNQAISIESDYLELKRRLNGYIINMYYLGSQ